MDIDFCVACESPFLETPLEKDPTFMVFSDDNPVSGAFSSYQKAFDHAIECVELRHCDSFRIIKIEEVYRYDV